MKRNQKILLFCYLLILLMGLDQLTKQLAKEHLRDKPVQSFFHDSFRLDYIENTGAFLSFGDDWPPAVSFWLMNVLPLLFLTGLLVYAIRKTATRTILQIVPFLLLCAGGFGNVIDRIMYDRHVTDFMNLGISKLRTGIFNVADVYVSAGVIMLLVMQWHKGREQRDLSR
ncbi:MAG: signal peptidase II [Chitinophagaceae bacterium]